MKDALTYVLQRLMDYLKDYEIATHNEIQHHITIHGCTIKSLQSLLCMKTGYKTFSEHIESHTPQTMDHEIRDYS